MKKLPNLEKKEESIFKLDLAPRLPTFKAVEKDQVDEKYPLIAPYAYAHIKWDKEKKELIYTVEEPNLDPKEKKILTLIEGGVKELINISYLAAEKGETVIAYLEKNVRVLLDELRITITKESYLKIMYYIYRDFVGLGRIEPLMKDPLIEDIECNGSDFPIFIVHRKFRNIKTNIIYKSISESAHFVERLAQKSGQYVSYASPLLDSALPDGSRVNATFTEDISSRGPTFTIRKFTKKPWTPTQLIHLKTLPPESLAYLWLLIEYEKNIMIVGGTASGKTTLLNALTFFIPPAARIVSIEDTRELNLEHSNWLPSVARAGVGLANLVGQKYGEVTLFNLLKESFRQNPDYVLVGEIRGEEAYVLFQGMASGHPSFGTMHANDVETMIRRLETPPINLSPSLVESMDAVVVMTGTKVNGKAVRRVKEIAEIISVRDEGAVINKPFTWNPATDSFIANAESHVFKTIIEQHGVKYEDLIAEYNRRAKLLKKLYEGKYFEFSQVQEIINEYYKDPAAVLSRFGVV
ncbi:type II/IV secretion system ATPase subunit [archaeon]|jgi:archaeal flagellar protein FlaI|nr:type II/IV secretion system ATPase subunit [archaeon]